MTTVTDVAPFIGTVGGMLAGYAAPPLVMQKRGQEDEYSKRHYKRLKILIVDDEPDIVQTLHKILPHNPT